MTSVDLHGLNNFAWTLYMSNDLMQASIPLISRRPSEPFVSVVMPCYNSKATIGECLTSLENQNYPRDRFEIIVADNGSTDGGVEFIRSQFPKVRLVQAREKGSGYARNTGIDASNGRFILSIDSDCVADSAWMKILVKALLDAPANVAAIGGLVAPYSRRTPTERYPPAWVAQPDPSGTIKYAATPNAIFVTKLLRAVDGFDGTLGFDDADLGLRLQAAGYIVIFTTEAVVRHRNPVTLAELYRHRYKYGQFSFALARKHPEILGDPNGAAKRRSLLLETLLRIAKNVLKLSLSLFYRPRGGSIGWPAVDAVMAWANYQGFVLASIRAEGQLH